MAIGHANLNTSHVKVKPWPFMALFKYIII